MLRTAELRLFLFADNALLLLDTSVGLQKLWTASKEEAGRLKLSRQD